MGYFAIAVDAIEDFYAVLDVHEINWIEVGFDLSATDLERVGERKIVRKIQEGSFAFIADLKDVIDHYDYFELDVNHSEFVRYRKFIPSHKLIISWSGTSRSIHHDCTELYPFLNYKAAYYKFVFHTKRQEDGILPIQLLCDLNREDVIAYSVGGREIWTHILSYYLGSPVIPTSLEERRYLPVDRLIQEYDLPNKRNVEQLYGIIGDPSYGSVSPALHNRQYLIQGLDYLYLPFESDNFVLFFRSLILPLDQLIPIKGLTVVSPFKRVCFEYATACFDPDVMQSQSPNLIVQHQNDTWAAHSTDGIGIVEALTQLDDYWPSRKIAIVGCGGAGKTMAARLKKMNVELTIVNRSVDKVAQFVKEIGASFIPLKDFNPEGYEIIIHATPMGKTGEQPFDFSKINRSAKVIDMVYSIDRNTALVDYCRLMNIQVIDGKEMAKIQIAEQFKYMTGFNYKEVTINTQVKN